MPSKKRKSKEQKPMLFSPLNYKLIGVGLLFLIIGFTAMRIENEVHGFISLYISPFIIMAGYVIVAYAILKRVHNNNHSSTHTSTNSST